MRTHPIYRSLWLAPFLPIIDRETALRAANGTVWAAGALCLNNVLVLAIAVFLNGTQMDGRVATHVVTALVLGAASGGLAWWAWRAHPRWVAIVVLSWSILVQLGPIIIRLLLTHNPGSILWPLLVTTLAIGGVRGAWALQKRPTPASVFD